MMQYKNTICIFGKYMKNYSPVVLNSVIENTNSLSSVRYMSKHWNPKWKKLRAAKVIKMHLPNFQEKDEDDMSMDKVRSKMKKTGLAPPRPWTEVPIFVSHTGSIFEAYIPPEGDGKFSPVTKEGAQQKMTLVQKKSKSMLAYRKIKSFDDTFNSHDFTDVATDIYSKAHETLAKGDDKDLLTYVTEKAYIEMTHNTKDKIIHWKFIESLEPTRVVHARCMDMMTKSNVFAQVTVRFHTQQMLAIYDRFGRLMHGSEILPKDVLEYVVFERHLANQYSNWRLHAKIIPPWMEPKEVYKKTFVVPKATPIEPELSETVQTSVNKVPKSEEKSPML